jgi:hypothetical protein
LQFWLPLVAAATCSYLGTRLSAVVRRRYALGETVSAEAEGEKTIITSTLPPS